MAAEDPKAAAQHLGRLVRSPPPFASSVSKRELSRNGIIRTIPALVKRMAEKKPLCHNMTNLVVQNFAANVALAIGSSPIMSNNGLEAGDLAALGGSL
ncbi:thiamine biosynthetic bifunctional enzyme, partial [Teratosphaeriaceae sp. CCFEE 6253]